MMKKVRLLQGAMLTVALFMASFQAFAQNVSVRGTVTDEAGSPLIGVNVYVDGTTIGTATGVDGTYQLSVAPSAEITYAFVGYASQVVAVGNRTTIDITLATDAQMIDDVVVIGYGTARRSDVTGSIASIDAKSIQQVQSGNVAQSLIGRIAGVNIIPTGSGPGAGMTIEIRGTRSLAGSNSSTANNPLIVLDGIPFPGELGDINPTDIMSIDILKDASSTAIYGSRGANGVILITTDKGTRSRKPTISYNGYAGIHTLFAPVPMMDGSTFVEYKKEAIANGSSWTFTDSEDQTGNSNADWQDLVLENGFVTSNNVSVSAPTENGSYSFGVSHYDEDGISPEQGFRRLGVRGSFDQQIGKRVRVGVTTQNMYSERTGADINVMGALLSTNTDINPYNEDGSVRQERFALNGTDANWNPLMYLENDGERVDMMRTFASYNTLYGEIEIVNGLKYRVNVGANYRQNNRGTFTTGKAGVWSGAATPSTSSAEMDNRHNFNWSVENMLTYDRVFGKHSLNAVAMYSAEQTLSYRTNVAASGVTIDQLQYYNLGLQTNGYTVAPNNQNYAQRSLLSYMGRVMYSYDNKYMLSATVRSDGASVLAPGHKWHTYPAVSAGWNISNEPFMQDIDWLTMLKLRAGYGQTSNQAIGPYNTYGDMDSWWYSGASGAVQGYMPNRVSNPNLGWEYSETWNFGVDFALFGGRLSGTAEYYVVNTNDLLLPSSPIPMSGIRGDFINNVAKTQNKGVEVSLNGVIIDNNNGWSWTAGLNFYTNKSKIVALTSGADRIESQNWFVGESINSIYAYQKTGIFQLGEEAYANGTGQAAWYPYAQPGSIKVAYNLKDGDPVTFDENGVPSRIINGSDRMIIGTTDANIMGGFNTTVGYKNLDLTVVGAFRQGGLLISSLHSGASYLNMLSGRRGQLDVDYWTEENPTNAYPKPGGPLGIGSTNSDNPSYGHTLGFFDASYLKIRTITLGYNFRGAWMERIGLGNLRVYASVQNPFVLFSEYTKESGLDPETNSYANQNAANTSGFMAERFRVVGYNTPSTRNFLFGLNLTF